MGKIVFILNAPPCSESVFPGRKPVGAYPRQFLWEYKRGKLNALIKNKLHDQTLWANTRYSGMNQQDEDLYYLIYTSRTSVPLEGLTLEEILKVSRSWNTEHSITGVLLYHNVNIMQVLEGTEREILPLFEHIQQYKRHQNVRRIAYRKADQRSFANWSMAFRTANENIFDEVHSKTFQDRSDKEAIYTAGADDSILSIINVFIAINPVYISAGL